MRLLLFISLCFLLFSCDGDSIFSKKETGVTKYIWQVNAQQLITDLINLEGQDNLLFLESLKEAQSIQDSTGQNFVGLLGSAYAKRTNDPLSVLFTSNKQLAIQASFSDEEVLEILQNQVNQMRTQQIRVIEERMEAFGINVLSATSVRNTDQYIVEVLGRQNKSKENVAKIGTLGFWELYENTDLSNPLFELNEFLKKGEKREDDLLQEENNLDYDEEDNLDYDEEFEPLFKVLGLNFPQFSSDRSATIGYAKSDDRQTVMNLLTSPQAKIVLKEFWNSIRFVWDSKSFENNEGDAIFQLYALNTKGLNASQLNQSHIQDSYATPNPIGKGFEISISMNEEGTIIWRQMTTDNVGQQIAIMLNNEVYSAPMVNEPIPNGNLSLSGGFEDVNTAKDFQKILSFKTILPYQPILIEQSFIPNKEQ